MKNKEKQSLKENNKLEKNKHKDNSWAYNHNYVFSEKTDWKYKVEDLRK